MVFTLPRKIIIWCLFTTLLGVFNWNVVAQKRVYKDIRFLQEDWHRLLQITELTQHPIFVYLYRPYEARNNKTIEQKLFTNSDVAQAYNHNLTSIKLNANSKQGFEFIKEYNITKYPAFLYFDYKGKLVFQSTVPRTIKQFIDFQKKATKLNKQTNQEEPTLAAIYTNYLSMKHRYRDGQIDLNREPEWLLDYAYQRKKFNDPHEDIVASYLASSAFNKAPKSRKNITFLYDFATDINGKALELLMKYRLTANKFIGAKKVETKVKGAVKKAIIDAANLRSERDLNMVITRIPNLKITNDAAFAWLMKAFYYETTNNWKPYNDAIQKYIQTAQPPKYEHINRAAWNLTVKSGRPEHLKKAEKWIRQLLQRSPNNPTYLQTYAANLYEAGKQRKAINECEKAINIAKAKQQNYANSLKLLGYIQKNKNIPKDLLN